MLFQMWKIGKECWIASHLFLFTWQDMRSRELSFLVLLEFLISGFLYGIAAGNRCCPWPGILLLYIAAVSGEKIGYGDGWLVLGMGMWNLEKEVWFALVTGCMLCAFTGILLKKRELPFVPFLTVGYFAGRYLM